MRKEVYVPIIPATQLNGACLREIGSEKHEILRQKKKKPNGISRKLITRDFRVCILQQKTLWNKELDIRGNQQGLRAKTHPYCTKFELGDLERKRHL